MSARTAERVVMQKADRCGQGKGGELKTGGNERISFMDDPYINQPINQSIN